MIVVGIDDSYLANFIKILMSHVYSFIKVLLISNGLTHVIFLDINPDVTEIICLNLDVKQNLIVSTVFRNFIPMCYMRVDISYMWPIDYIFMH